MGKNQDTWTKKRTIFYFFLTLGLFISLFYVFQFFSDVEFDLEIQIILMGGIIYMISLTLRGVRYQFICNLEDTNSNQLKLSTSIFGIYMGWGFNTFLPARLGELSRIYLSEKYDGVTKEKTIDSIIIEKILDLTTMALLGLTSFGIIWYNYQLTSTVYSYAIVMGIIILVGGISFILFTRLDVIIPWVSKIPKVGSLLERMVQIIKTKTILLKNKPIKSIPILLSSLGVWILDVSVFILILTSITTVPLAIAVFTVISGFLAFIVPILPNATGQYESIVGGVLFLFGFSFERGFQAAFYDHIIKAIFALSLCGLVLVYLGLSPLLIDELDDLEE